MRGLINKKNIYLLVLLVICLLGIIIVPTYAKFGSSYATDGDVVGLLLDFDLSITNIEEYQVVFVPAGESQVYNIEIKNNMASTAYYGVWYRMVSPSEITSDITITQLSDSTVATTGGVSTGDTVTVNIVVVNDSDSSIKFDIGVASSASSISDIEYLNGKALITGSVSFLIDVVSAGDYVSYTGSNGCSGNACSGQNANYTSDSSMGYCYNSKNESTYQFSVNGWRIGYISDGIAYLISAGAPECLATSVDGETAGTSFSTVGDSSSATAHLTNMDTLALKYCNINFAYGGKCNSSTTWAMDATDFQGITGSALSSSSCFNDNTSACGVGNSLIENGSYYWLATLYSSSEPEYLLHYSSLYAHINSGTSYTAYGVRPVIKLATGIIVTGGSGTYTDPYTITI